MRRFGQKELKNSNLPHREYGYIKPRRTIVASDSGNSGCQEAKVKKVGTKFTGHGPFDVPRIHKVIQKTKSLKEVWVGVSKEIAERNGCYVFAVRSGVASLRIWAVKSTLRKSYLASFCKSWP